MKEDGNSSKTNYMRNIAEILGIFDEKSLSKDWLLGELKRYKIKTRTLDSLNIFEILKSCQPETVERILSILDDQSAPDDPDEGVVVEEGETGSEVAPDENTESTPSNTSD